MAFNSSEALAEKRSEVTWEPQAKDRSDRARGRQLDQYRLPQGAELLPGGGLRFRLWGPGLDQISVGLEEEGKLLPMVAKGDGWHEAEAPEAQAGTLYRFVLPNCTRVPEERGWTRRPLQKVAL